MAQGKLKIIRRASVSVAFLFIAACILLPVTNAAQTQPALTEKKTDNPPTVSIIQPETNTIYFRDIKLFQASKTIIFGFVTIKAFASDDSGIQRVDFYIDGVLRNTSTVIHHCGSYMWIWNERTIFKSKHSIKVITFDLDGNTAEDTCDVSIHNIPRFHPLYP